MTQIRDWREKPGVALPTIAALIIAFQLPKPPILGPWHFLLDGGIVAAAWYVGWPMVRRLLATWE